MTHAASARSVCGVFVLSKHRFSQDHLGRSLTDVSALLVDITAKTPRRQEEKPSKNADFPTSPGSLGVFGVILAPWR
jgi:hypothetical protein